MRAFQCSVALASPLDAIFAFFSDARNWSASLRLASLPEGERNAHRPSARRRKGAGAVRRRRLDGCCEADEVWEFRGLRPRCRPEAGAPFSARRGAGGLRCRRRAGERCAVLNTRLGPQPDRALALGRYAVPVWMGAVRPMEFGSFAACGRDAGQRPALLFLRAVGLENGGAAGGHASGAPSDVAAGSWAGFRCLIIIESR